MDPFFTRKGDEGYSSLLGEGKYLKTDLRFDILGTIDEASAALGLARSLSHSEKIKFIILKIQADLSHLMGEIAATPANREKYQFTHRENVEWVEDTIHELEREVAAPEAFIFPGDCSSGAAVDLARTIIRRVERLMVGYAQGNQSMNTESLHYLNRLSSLCYIIELFEVQSSKQ
jgi:cob(I)alamin adenosyltransferase